MTKEEKKAYQAAWYQKNKEKVKARAHKYYHDNIEEGRAKRREYERTHRAEANVRSLKWAKANADKRQVHVRVNNLRKRGGEFDGETWAKIIESQHHLCFDCGELDTLTVGHLHPVALGGSNARENLVGQCFPCNRKQGKKFHPALAGKRFYRSEWTQ
jgi:5-methylcytosine-specific restriction endonuclease McrA